MIGKLIIFSAETLFGICIDKFVSDVKERRELKKIIEGISTFNINFDNTEVDIGSFQKFIEKQETVDKVFLYFFGIDNQKKDRIDLINELTIQALQWVNNENEKYNRPVCGDSETIREYFEALFEELDNQRNTRITLADKIVIARLSETIQTNFNELRKLITEQIFSVDDVFIIDNLNTAIKTLGGRYSEDLNIITENGLVFETLFVSKKYIARLNELYHILVEQCEKRIDDFENTSIKASIVKFKESIKVSLNEINLLFENLSEKEQIVDALVNIEKQFPDLKCFEGVSKTDENQFRSFFYRIRIAISDCLVFLRNSAYELVHSPYLFVYGEAGIGKSHLLADTAKNKIEENHDVMLFLGQHFSDSQDPWKQIIEGLSINATVDQFLTDLEKRAIEKQKRACIMIDALNEGEGRKLWYNHFQRFFDKLKKYPHISFVFSIRSNFVKEVLPEDFIKNNDITEKEHFGFSEQKDRAIKGFCEYYNLDEPLFPIMNAEYSNPLFLKMTCQLLMRESVSEFSLYGRNIGEIFADFIKNINKELSKRSRLNYDEEINIVQEVLNGLLDLMHKTEYQFISYEDAHKIATQIASKNSIQSPALFLRELVSEGLLTKTETYKKEQKIYFCYERLSDYYMAEYLYEQYFKYIEPNEDISKHDQLKKYFSNEEALNFNSGVISALSIILPEKNCGELFEFVKKNKENFTIIEGFLDSLIWRLPSSINNITSNYIKEIVFVYEATTNSFYKKQIQLSCYPEHPLNSEWLYEFLKSFSMAERDLIWTAIISGNYDNPYNKYIKWANEKGNLLSEEISLLMTMQLGWQLTLNDRTLRDTATKAIIRLLIEFPNNIIPYFNKMKCIDDPYVLERIYAILFGVVVKIDLTHIGKELAINIYETIFNTENVYPHILLRDYAKQTIKYLETKVENLSDYIDENKIQPPYNSDWYNIKITNEDIDNLSETYAKKSRSADSAFSAITSSMITEHGRGTGMYGDFGRYTFGSGVSDWSNQFNDQDLSNLAIIRILELGYSPEHHGEYDYNFRSYDRHDHKMERIGKKYQWIAFHELLAKLTDNFPTYNEEIIYDDEYKAYQANRSSLSEIIFKSLETDNLRELVDQLSEEDEDSDVMNADDHIIDKKKHFHKAYSGTWDWYIRDIDPTLMNVIPEQSNTFFDFNCPQEPSDEWVEDNSIFDQTADFLEVEYEGKDYICLYSYVKKQENKEKEFRDRTSVVILAGAFFAGSDQKDKLIEQRKKINGNGVPNPTINGLFLHELFWSDGFMEWKNSYEQENDTNIVATYNYLWEATNDYSNEKTTASFNVPCNELVDYFKLIFVGNNTWKNEKDELISFDGSLLGYDNCLLFRKEEVLKFIKNNDYDLYWGIYTEKISNRKHHEWWYTTEYSNGTYKKYVFDENLRSNNNF
ncbi:ATP-binding protein [Listeria booriae]|uniref:ATP-binding protein n=1 Tax=Listeria booriae TaxID=1552123 RepID=UPI0016293B28|nr:ATP-binding protein [Listeria booriae]MBC1802171.1 ATP-binding protein [Listeria booriae]